MSLSEFEIKKIEKVVGEYIERKRPAPHIRSKLDFGFEINNQSVEIYEIRPIWNNPEEYHNLTAAKATYIKTQKVWKIYWQRADLKWHSYTPVPSVKNIEEFISVVEQDTHACFWG